MPVCETPRGGSSSKLHVQAASLLEYKKVSRATAACSAAKLSGNQCEGMGA
jgi:hypothetical protein